MLNLIIMSVSQDLRLWIGKHTIWKGVKTQIQIKHKLWQLIKFWQFRAKIVTLNRILSRKTSSYYIHLIVRLGQ